MYYKLSQTCGTHTNNNSYLGTKEYDLSLGAGRHIQLVPKGTYNGRRFPVSNLPFLRKRPLFRLETASPSSREATAKARAPRLNRRGELRCMASSSQVDGALGSHMSLAVSGLGARQNPSAASVLLQRRPPASSSLASLEMSSSARKRRRMLLRPWPLPPSRKRLSDGGPFPQSWWRLCVVGRCCGSHPWSRKAPRQHPPWPHVHCIWYG